MIIKSDGGQKWERPTAKVLQVPKPEDFKPEEFDLYEQAYDQYLYNTSIAMLRIPVKCETMAQYPCRQMDPTKPGFGGYVYDKDNKMVTEWKPVHTEAQRCWACAHLTPQLNQDQPNGIVMCLGYYVCFDCQKLIDQHKFKFEHELLTMCHPCIVDVQKHITAIDPSKVKIRRQRGGLGQGKN